MIQLFGMLAVVAADADDLAGLRRHQQADGAKRQLAFFTTVEISLRFRRTGQRASDGLVAADALDQTVDAASFMRKPAILHDNSFLAGVRLRHRLARRSGHGTLIAAQV